MSIIPVNRDLLYRTKVRLNPQRTFISSSSGVTGSVFVFPNRSITQKDNIDERLADIFEVAQSDPQGFISKQDANQFRPYSGNSLEQRRIEIYSGDFSKFGSGQGFVDRAIESENARPTNFEVQLALLLDGAGPYDSRSTWPPEIEKNQAVQLNTNFAHKGYSDFSAHPRNTANKNIASTKGNHLYFSSASLRIRNFINSVIPLNYENVKSGYDYSNFHCLNFFSDNETTGSYAPAVCYSSTGSEYAITPVEAGGGFTFEFWLKPSRRHTTPGIIMSYGGHYAIWLEPTEYSSEETYPTKFRLKFGFDTNANFNSTFLSATDAISASDLLVDDWNHCVLRWGSDFNGGRISYVINGVVSGETSFAATMTNNPAGGMLVLGAKFGLSASHNTGVFGSYSSGRYGSPDWGEAGVTGSMNNQFISSSQAELHEVRIWNKPRTVSEINTFKNKGVNHAISGSLLKFHLPVLFETGGKRYFNRLRPNIDQTVVSQSVWYGGRVGVNTAVSKYFDSPFNPNWALNAGFPDINVSAFLREQASGNHPAIRNLDVTLSNTASITQASSEWPNYYGQRRRTGFIFPCDNGDFYPYFLNSSGSARYKDNSRRIDLLGIGDETDESSVKYAFIGAALDTTDAGRSRAEAIKEPGVRTEVDLASNLSTLVNVPILFYGDRIKPGSLEIHSHISSSIYTKIVDDGYGNLIRSNTSGSVAHWNKVGQVAYDTGAICIMSPHLFNFMQDEYKIILQGEKHLNVFEINVPCEVGTLTQSKNTTYKILKPSADANETDNSFVYITGIYLHDENLNVIGKAHLAQPIVKRPSDNFLFRLKMDY